MTLSGWRHGVSAVRHAATERRRGSSNGPIPTTPRNSSPEPSRPPAT